MSSGRLAAVALLSSLALVAAGCTAGGDSPSGDSGPGAQGTAAGALLSGRWPLTGLPTKQAPPPHPVMVVKIDNTESSAPQVGLRKADLITEELVEGGVTRLAVFFYTHLAPVAGPVRSMRASDIGILKPAHALLVASGGAPKTVRVLDRAHIRSVTEGAPGFYRDNGRSAPYNLFMKLPALAKSLKAKDRKAPPPPPYLPWGGPKSLPSGPKAKSVDVSFSPSHTTSWSYRGGSYDNDNSNAADAGQFKADTVLVLRVKVGDAGYRDPAGNPVPETHFVGSGDAMVFHRGSLVRATWKKPQLNSPVRLATKGGPLSLPPGHVWIELVPKKGGKVSFR